MSLITTANFTGYFQVPIDSATQVETLLQDFIDRNENLYIYRLLGATLGSLYIADLANVSQEERFAVITDPIHMDDPDNTDSGIQYHSRGMANMLTAFIFHDFVVDNQAFLTQSGVSINANEAQTVLSPMDAARYAERKFNEALLEDYRTIQWYCNVYADTLTDTDLQYPEYNGQKISPKFAGVL